MRVREVVESSASRKISQIIVKLLDNCSDGTLTQLTLLAEKLTNEEEVLSAIGTSGKGSQTPTTPRTGSSGGSRSTCPMTAR